MKFEIVTKNHILRKVPRRWSEQYKDTTSPEHQGVTRNLDALKWPFTADQVNSIIGNKSWTKLECDGCESDSEFLAVFDKYDTTISLCKNCIKELGIAVSIAEQVMK